MASDIRGIPGLNECSKVGKAIISTGTETITINQSDSPTNIKLQIGTNQTGVCAGRIAAYNQSNVVTFNMNGELGLAIGSSTNDASAWITITSTSKGFLMSRMTTAQKNAISSPAEGLIVYDLTEHKPYVYNGTSWESLL